MLFLVASEESNIDETGSLAQGNCSIELVWNNVVVPKDDSFGISSVIDSTTDATEEAEIYESHADIKAMMSLASLDQVSR